MIIEAKAITKTVATSDGPLQILQPLNMAVQAAESVAIVGASGSGKSTLLSLLAGLDEVTSGEIYLAGQPLHKLDEEQRAQLRGDKVGFIFQSFMLIQSLSALENVMLPGQIAGLDDADERARQILQQVGLSHRSHHYPNQLSGGEQQRVAIARAFMTSPALLFADEPTGNLDAGNGAKVQQLLFDMNHQSGTTLILVTHDDKLASGCDRQLYMQGGQLYDSAQQANQHVG